MLIPFLLPFVGLIFVVLLFNQFRAKKDKLKLVIYGYLLLTFVLPICMYTYSGLVLRLIPIWGMLLQLSSMVVLSPILFAFYQRYSYQSDSDYFYSVPNINNSNLVPVRFPHPWLAFCNAWLILLSIILFFIFQILWQSKTNHQLDFTNFYLAGSLICACIFLLYLCVLRIIPRCSYCKQGILDFDMRFKPESSGQKQEYNKQFFKKYAQIMQLKPFCCQKCKAPFVMKKRDLNIKNEKN